MHRFLEAVAGIANTPVDDLVLVAKPLGRPDLAAKAKSLGALGQQGGQLGALLDRQRGRRSRRRLVPQGLLPLGSRSLEPLADGSLGHAQRDGNYFRLPKETLFLIDNRIVPCADGRALTVLAPSASLDTGDVQVRVALATPLVDTYVHITVEIQTIIDPASRFPQA